MTTHTDRSGMNGHNAVEDPRAYALTILRGLNAGTPVPYSAEKAGDWASLLDFVQKRYDPQDLELFRTTINALAAKYGGAVAELVNDVQGTKSTATIESEEDVPAYPPLPEHAQLPPELSNGVCPLRDAYVQYSATLSPEGYQSFHDGTFWWLLSTIAARRVYADFSEEQYTPLYIVLAARTSLYAKSVTANVGRKVLVAAGMDWLLGADRTTPQRLLQEMSGIIPEQYSLLSYEEQEFYKLRLAFSGQRGWINDEFGKFVKGILRQNSIMSEFADLLLTFDNCLPKYKNATISRGGEPVDRPYLAMLGCMTPANVRDNAKTGAEFWSDGFWARFAFITPPPGTDIDAPFTRDKKPVPETIVKTLREWHERLGAPQIDIEPRCKF